MGASLSFLSVSPEMRELQQLHQRHVEAKQLEAHQARTVLVADALMRLDEQIPQIDKEKCRANYVNHYIRYGTFGDNVGGCETRWYTITDDAVSILESKFRERHPDMVLDTGSTMNWFGDPVPECRARYNANHFFNTHN